MTFIDKLKQKSKPIVESQFSHPFVTGLADGTLPIDIFQYYMIQDMLYIVDYARAMTWIAPLMPDVDDVMRMLDAAKETFEIETVLKEQYFKEFKISKSDLLNVKTAPSCKSHIDHLFRYTRSGTLAEGLSAILPCSWIYVEIGLHFTSGKEIPDSNRYKSWLLTYADPAFIDMVEWWFDMLENIVKNMTEREQEHIQNIFLDSCHYEWLFWEMSWKKEKWNWE